MDDLNSDDTIEENFREMKLFYVQRMQRIRAEAACNSYDNVFQPRSSMELRALQSYTITNLYDFAHIRFYHKKNVYVSGEYFLKKGAAQYLVADNYKLYTVLNNKLVQGQFNGKAQCWKLPQ